MINDGSHFAAKSIRLNCLPFEDLCHVLGVVPEKDKKLDLSNLLFWGKIYADDIFVLLTIRRQLLISIDGVHFKAVGPFRDASKGHLTTVHFFANVFAMGFTSGHIYLYTIHNPIDLLSMDFEAPKVILETGHNQIVGIDIGPGIEPGTLCLIATCENEAHVFSII